MANQLHRERAALSPAALAYLALTLVEIDRKPMAFEATCMLAKQNLNAPAIPGEEEQGPLPGCRSGVEIRTLYAMVSKAVAPKGVKTKELIDWLLAHRSGFRSAPDKATGPAMLALCEWFAQSRFEGERYKLAISVNDMPVTTLDVDPAAGSRAIAVPTTAFAKGKQKVQFQLTGRGRSCVPVRLSWAGGGRQAQEHGDRLGRDTHLRAGAVEKRWHGVGPRIRQRSGW